MFVVAASGNSGSATPAYLARHSAELQNVVSVGAHDSRNVLADFTNRAGGTSRQLDAPGVGIYSTLPANRFGVSSGTSMAAPHVAGVAALALSARPELTARELSWILLASADRPVAGSNAAGGVNAALALGVPVS